MLSGEIMDDPETVLTRRLGTNLPREVQVTVRANFTWKERDGAGAGDAEGFQPDRRRRCRSWRKSAEDAEQLAIERLAAAIVDQMQEEW